MNTWKWFKDMPGRFKTKDLWEKVAEEEIDMVEYVPNELKTQEMYEYAVREEVEMFLDTPNEFRSQEMCDYVIMKRGGHWLFPDINDKFQTLETCNQAVSELPWCLQFVPNKYKTRDMCKQCSF